MGDFPKLSVWVQCNPRGSQRADTFPTMAGGSYDYRELLGRCNAAALEDGGRSPESRSVGASRGWKGNGTDSPLEPPERTNPR